MMQIQLSKTHNNQTTTPTPTTTNYQTSSSTPTTTNHQTSTPTTTPTNHQTNPTTPTTTNSRVNQLALIYAFIVPLLNIPLKLPQIQLPKTNDQTTTTTNHQTYPTTTPTNWATRPLRCPISAFWSKSKSKIRIQQVNYLLHEWNVILLLIHTTLQYNKMDP